MKKRGLLAVLLVMATVFTMLAGCAASPTNEPVSTPEQSASAEPSATADEPAAPESQPPESSAEPDPQDTAKPADDLISNITSTDTEETNAAVSQLASSIDIIQYPISGDLTLTYWNVFPSFIFGDIISGWDEMPALPIIEEATGVKIEFISPSQASATEQFNLMIVAQTYPDLFSLRDYSGGVQLAYEEDVCIDLTDLVPDYAPNYYAFMQTADDYTMKQLVTEENKILQISALASEVLNEQGLALRQDWLDKWGMDTPTTVDQMYEYLSTAKNEYNCKYPMFIDGGGLLDGFTGAFGIVGLNLERSDASLMLDGERVVSSLNKDGFRAYMETLAKWYSEGIINSEFYSEQYGPDYINAYVCDDDCALTTIRGDKFETMRNSASDPDFMFVGISALTLNEGDSYKFMQKTSLKGNSELSISTKNLYPEESLMFLNWFFTNAGYLVANYGEEGLVFEYNDRGEPEYTEFVINNPNGWNMMSVRNLFTNPVFPYYQNATSLIYTYPDYELEAIEKWGVGSDECSMPQLSLTTEENSEYALLVSDLGSYASEQVLKWIVGTEPLNDDAWSAFVAQLDTLKLSRIEEIYQAAYDRYYK